MNTERQLRHAADEMDRATASLTPPPLDELRRSARIRAIGVSVAAAVGAAVLIGGAVLMLRPPAETTLAPAGPTETTATVATTTTAARQPEVPSFEGIPVVAPDLDPEPESEIGGIEIEPTPIPAGYTADIEMMKAHDLWDEFTHIDEIQFIGQVDIATAYVLKGEAIPNDLGDTRFACVLVVNETPWGVCNYSEDAHLVVTSTDTFPSLAGWVGESVSVVSMNVDGSEIWARTRGGYAFVGIDSGVPASLDFTAYASDGSIVSRLWELDAASAADCSGAGIYPSALALSSVPQPVAETLAGIVEAARVCDFDDLAGVSAGMFTASFGGMDPVELWTFEEEEGYEPMRFLMQILDMPYGTAEVDGRVLYIWPAAAAHDGDWTTVPEQDKEALRSLYDDDDFAGFESFGAYIGYRTGIYEDGDWSFFVAGD